MFDANPLHPELSFALDVADKGIKLCAVLLGGVWTYWNYRKSRTYEKKLDLQLTAIAFRRGDLYVEIVATIENVGASRHILEQDRTFCTIFAVMGDLTQEPLQIIPAFSLNNQLEPGESADDALFWRILDPPPNMIWLKLNLQTVSGSITWYTASLLRIE